MVSDRNESFTFPVGPENKTLIIEVQDHKTFGKDKLLADGSVDVMSSLLRLILV